MKKVLGICNFNMHSLAWTMGSVLTGASLPYDIYRQSVVLLLWYPCCRPHGTGRPLVQLKNTSHIHISPTTDKNTHTHITTLNCGDAKNVGRCVLLSIFLCNPIQISFIILIFEL